MKLSTFPLLLAAALLAACGTGGDGSSVGTSEGRATGDDCLGGEFGGDCEEGEPEDEPENEHVAPGTEVKGDCVKFEDAAIGADGLSFDFGGASVSIDAWLEKGDSPGEQIGFDWTVVGGDVYVRVKTGGEVHEDTFSEGSDTWVHPEGTEGPEAPAISHIVFCGPDGSSGEGGAYGEGGASGEGGGGGWTGEGGASGEGGSGGSTGEGGAGGTGGTGGEGGIILG